MAQDGAAQSVDLHQEEQGEVTMPITSNTIIPTWASTTTAADIRTDADIAMLARQEAKEVINADTAIQFLRYLIISDPEISAKFTAFRTAMRMGVVK
jgi:hypothetical protein